MTETDYIGMVSGKKVDKSGVFDIFYGSLAKAPMIKACPVCMECRLFDTYDTTAHDLFIGEIVETHAEESVLTDGKVDVSKVRPLLFDMNTVKYWSLGPAVASCWSVGKQLKK